MYTISKEFHFSAGHRLLGLEEDHPCGTFHGHNYVLTLFLKSPLLTPEGFVMDYRKLSFIRGWIQKNLDHKYLNDVFQFNPTVENMGSYLFQLFKKDLPLLHAIEISETPKTKCRYEP